MISALYAASYPTVSWYVPPEYIVIAGAAAIGFIVFIYTRLKE